ncbi:MAG TPA: hypothetical protein VHY37_04370 [Tepidisphaeraceae bacterium]|jgi:hypothetical protein|nr:hypothetical protein [Tepidisphaeraceae bacterium]
MDADKKKQGGLLLPIAIVIIPYMSALLREIEKMVDALDDSDRHRLMQYLSPRVAGST